jgi:flagella basal body P-ring formation protein FlgA
MRTQYYRQRRTRLLSWLTALILAAGLTLLTSATAAAANLRPFRELAGGIVRLSDLFDALGDTPDRDLGPSPAPGDRIVVEAPQLAAIASDFGVAWRPRSGAERAVLERGGTALAQDAVMTPLRSALATAGAPAQCDIDMPGFTAPVVPAGAQPLSAISNVTYDPGTGRFGALLSVTAPDMPTFRSHLSGQVFPLMDAAVLIRHLHPGAVIRAEDVRAARVRAGLLRGNSPLGADGVTGMALRHDLPPGQPITIADITRPILVARNGLVRMRLEAGGLLLSAQGTALEDGGMGDRVRVQNPTSHAVIIAEVTGDAEVRVEPGRAPVYRATP